MTTTVCLSIDIDGYGPALFAGEANQAVLSRGEFDARVATPRLLALLEELALPATFFVPGHTADAFPATVEAVLRAGHEVAHHGYLHEPPAQLGPEREEAVLQRGIESLRRLTGRPPRGYRAPLWEPSDRTIGLLERHGFSYDSSLMGTDFLPYLARAGDGITGAGVRFGTPTGVVELPSSWVFDDWSYFANSRRPGGGGATPPSHVLEIWSEQIEFAAESVPGAVVVLTLHPQVSAQGYVLRMLRRLLGGLARDGRFRFRSMEAAAEDWRTTGSGAEGTAEAAGDRAPVPAEGSDAA